MKKIESLKDYQDYLNGVFGRVKCHAGRVRHTVTFLAGIVASVAEPGSIGVRAYGDDTKNVAWFRANGKEYCLSYNHAQQCVDVRVGGLQGETIMQVNDNDFGWLHDLKVLLDPREAEHACAA